MKERSYGMAIIIGTITAMLHLCLQLLLMRWMLVSHDGEWPMAWVIVGIFDLPVSLFYMLLPSDSIYQWLHPYIVQSSLAGTRMGDIPNFILPSFYFGIVGTTWWFSVGFWVTKFFQYLSRKWTNRVLLSQR